MTIFDDCKHYYGTENLYEVLLIDRDATDSQLKKAYKLVSLKVHPDHADEEHKEEATRKFQTLAKVYFILSDEDKRKIYDETGDADEESDGFKDKNWSDYWRLLFPRITEEDIISYLEKYKGSKEEQNDLKNYYLKFDGDMDKMSEYLPGFDPSEEERYSACIYRMIEDGEIPTFKKFTNESKKNKKRRKSRLTREAKEAEDARKKLKINKGTSLAEMISSNQGARERKFNDMISSLEAKYAKPQRKKK